MSDLEKKRPVPEVERIRPIKRDSMMAVQSRTADLPVPFMPTRTLICSGNSNLNFGIPLNPSISMDSILICFPVYRQKNVEHCPERRSADPGVRVRCRPGRAEEVSARERGQMRGCERDAFARAAFVTVAGCRIILCRERRESGKGEGFGTGHGYGGGRDGSACPATFRGLRLPNTGGVASGNEWRLSMRHRSGSLSAAVLDERAGDRGKIVASGTTERTPSNSIDMVALVPRRGTHSARNSPARYRRASFTASSRSVFARSPPSAAVPSSAPRPRNGGLSR